jgi:hypothetical protein
MRQEGLAAAGSGDWDRRFFGPTASRFLAFLIHSILLLKQERFLGRQGKKTAGSGKPMGGTSLR